jgi:hypothetical protein
LRGAVTADIAVDVIAAKACIAAETVAPATTPTTASAASSTATVASATVAALERFVAKACADAWGPTGVAVGIAGRDWQRFGTLRLRRLAVSPLS